MNSFTPGTRAMLGWRIHYGLAVVASSYSAWEGFRALSDSLYGVVSPRVIAALIAPVIVLVIAPLIAEWGLISQRGYEKRALWRAIFIACACAFAGGAGFSIVMAVRTHDSLFATDDDVVRLGCSLIATGQLLALWLYAYGSEHLWRHELYGVASS